MLSETKKGYLLENAGDGDYAFRWEETFQASVLQGQNYPTLGILNPSGATITLRGGYIKNDLAQAAPLENGVITESKCITLIAPVPWLHINISGSSNDVSIWKMG